MFHFFPIIPMNREKHLGPDTHSGNEMPKPFDDGVLAGNESQRCEQTRFESQPALLDACRTAMEL
jgi:hypothetical protein